MSQEVKGNLSGLSPSETRLIEKLFRRRLDSDEVVSLELAREICHIAESLRRRIGVLVSREGTIEEVVVGSRDILYLPDLGRYRLGAGRLRRLRLLFSDLSKQDQVKIPSDIFVDLEKLRLDMVVALKAKQNRIEVGYAHLIPKVPIVQDSGKLHQSEVVSDLGAWKFDFDHFIENLEGELTASMDAQHRSGKTGAVLVGVYEASLHFAQSSMAELEELARTAGVQILDRLIQRRQHDPRTLLGKGKLEEVVLRSLGVGADMLIFDAELKPAQWRAITNATELKVIDRSMLILDIFAQRATSSEGRLQVELAQHKYNLPRLVEKDAGLSRLSGGIGGRGPGETKLEIGRRRIRDRIVELETKISKLGNQRDLRRSRRVGNEIPLIAILGYTNAGKSTLFNALTKSSVLVEDKLFATLDPAQRKLALPWRDENNFEITRMVIVSDTVGFIRALPEELLSAFRATLEELHQADVLLHVLDVSDPEIEMRKKAVDKIIAEMEIAEKPTLVVLNKIDRIQEEQAKLLSTEYEAIAVSALKRQGFVELKEAISAKLRSVVKDKELPVEESTLG